MLSITQDDGNERFVSGAAALNVTGTWFYSEMQRQFDDDWDMLSRCRVRVEVRSGARARPKRWSSRRPRKTLMQPGLFLDFCIKGTGAKVLLERGNLLATKAFGELAIPQIQRLANYHRRRVITLGLRLAATEYAGRLSAGLGRHPFRDHHA